MTSKVVIFDWGGVLMRTEERAPRLAWDQRLNLAPGSVESVVHGIPAWREAQRGEIDLAAYWQNVADELRLDADELRELQQDFYRGDQLDRSLVELIRGLRQDGVRVALLSNNIRELVDEMQQLDVMNLFEPIVISAHLGVMKPDPQAYRTILDLMGIRPEDAAFVDDFIENVEGARAVGMHGILFSPELDLGAELRDWLNAD